jgi:hypothetical protein
LHQYSSHNIGKLVKKSHMHGESNQGYEILVENLTAGVNPGDAIVAGG